MDLKIGDKVKLVSGGPIMTIHRIIGMNIELFNNKLDAKLTTEGFISGDVICEWFNRNKLERKPFKTASLLKVK